MDAIRPATADDAPDVARIHVAGWKAFYRDRVPDAMLEGLDEGRRTEGWRRSIAELRDPGRTWVFERDGRVIGFCDTNRSADPGAPPATGEVRAIYLDPDVVGTGVGRRLLAHAVDELRRQGFSRATLWVLGSNDLGRRFYEAAGWWPDGVEKDEPWGHHVLHEVRYATDLGAATPPPAS